ncbi:hypothetical protein VHEMI10347 [[Torrubiella] hemipterigena]|uniref:Uncharacterized protein n=1 Tax=[Torrubiella] hemipterigena TaxID=1531966 RepID=A0A0A1TIJ6_9HYPO|nr:hypothetical protein VHEMI10347 [[Torrubiella] hemipterigena]
MALNEQRLTNTQGKPDDLSVCYGQFTSGLLKRLPSQAQRIRDFKNYKKRKFDEVDGECPSEEAAQMTMLSNELTARAAAIELAKHQSNEKFIKLVHAMYKFEDQMMHYAITEKFKLPAWLRQRYGRRMVHFRLPSQANASLRPKHSNQRDVQATDTEAENEHQGNVTNMPDATEASNREARREDEVGEEEEGIVYACRNRRSRVPRVVTSPPPSPRESPSPPEHPLSITHQGTTTFEEIFNNGLTQREIIEFPKGMNMRYVLYCKQCKYECSRKLTADFKPTDCMRSAIAHMRPHKLPVPRRLTDWQCKQYDITNMQVHIVETMGILVLHCTEAEQDRNNEFFYRRAMAYELSGMVRPENNGQTPNRPSSRRGNHVEDSEFDDDEDMPMAIEGDEESDREPANHTRTAHVESEPAECISGHVLNANLVMEEIKIPESTSTASTTQAGATASAAVPASLSASASASASVPKATPAAASAPAPAPTRVPASTPAATPTSAPRQVPGPASVPRYMPSMASKPVVSHASSPKHTPMLSSKEREIIRRVAPQGSQPQKPPYIVPMRQLTDQRAHLSPGSGSRYIYNPTASSSSTSMANRPSPVYAHMGGTPSPAPTGL